MRFGNGYVRIDREQEVTFDTQQGHVRSGAVQFFEVRKPASSLIGLIAIPVATLFTKPPILESSPLAKELYNICEGNFTEKQIQALEIILKEIVFPGYSESMEGIETTFLPGQYGYVECTSYLKMFYKYTLDKNKYKYLKKVLENQKDELNKKS